MEKTRVVAEAGAQARVAVVERAQEKATAPTAAMIVAMVPQARAAA